MRVNYIHMMQLNLWSHKISATVTITQTALANTHAQSNEYTTMTLKEVRQDKHAQQYYPKAY